MSKEQTLPSTRERLVARCLLIVAELLCGKSFNGGVDGDIQKQIAELREAITRQPS